MGKWQITKLYWRLKPGGQVLQVTSNKVNTASRALTDASELLTLYTDSAIPAPPVIMHVSAPYGTTFTLNSPKQPIVIHLSTTSSSHTSSTTVIQQTAQPHSKFQVSSLKQVRFARKDKINYLKDWEPPSGWDRKSFKPEPLKQEKPTYFKPFFLAVGPRPRRHITELVQLD